MATVLEDAQIFGDEVESQEIPYTDRSQSRPIVRYGSLWSQYHTLDASTIVPLEQAVLYCQVRAFKESLAIYDEFPEEIQHHPIVAFEKSLTFWALWRLLDCANVLRKALSFADSENSQKSNTPGIYTLLRATLGLTEIYSEGNFTQAKMSLMEIRKWLLNTSIDEYNDLQIYCLNRYYIIVMLVSQNVEEFDSKYFLCIPHVPNDTNGLKMVPLRKFLQSRGRLLEAGLILNFELGFQPNHVSSEGACRSLLEACSSSAVGQEPVWYAESKARLHLAKSLSGQGQHEQAAEEFELAKRQLQQAPVPTALNRTEINVRFVELQSSADTNPHHSLKKWKDFAKSLSKTENSSELSSARERIAAAAHEILESDPSEENRKLFWELQSLEESMLEKLGDVYTIYLHRTTRVHMSSVNYNGAGDILTWQRDFELNHPNFCIWSLKIMKRRQAMIIYKQLQDEKSFFRMMREIRDLTHDRDVFWSGVDERCTFQIETAQDQVSDSGDDERTNEAFRPTGMGNMWLSEWEKEVSIGIGMYRRSVVNVEETGRESARLKTLLMWLKSGSSRGELSKGDLERILFPICENLSTGNRIQSFKGILVKRRAAENEDEESEIDDLLVQLTPTTLGIQVFGTEESPTSSVHWQEAFTTLRDWLFKRANYNETKRHTLLLDLQTQMLWKVIDIGSLAQQVLEAQRILDLVPTLCPEARNDQSLGVWRNVSCGFKRTALMIEDGIEAQFEDHPKFREIADLYELTLNESQMRGRPFMQAVTSASLASHYSCAAWHLRPEAIEPFFRYCSLAEQSFHRIRESWKLLRGWEKVEKLTMAVDESFRYRIAASAVIVLSRLQNSAGVNLDQSIWTTIQKEKSWGLGWLMQTNSLQGIDDMPVGEKVTSDFNPLPVITLDDLQSTGSDTEGGVIYVDWYDGRRNTLDPSCSSNVLLLTVSNGEPPRSWQLEITWARVDQLVKKFLDCDEDEFQNGNAMKLLQKLNPLVQPLRQVSKPGQVLVFSAIGDLHCIPLHALKIDNEFLIRRNPIVYCSSMTVLNVVFRERKKYEEQAKNDGRRFGLSLCLGEIPSDEGKESQKSLVQMFAMKGCKEEPLKDHTFTTEQFENAIRRPNLDLFHYHGHANFDNMDPLHQSLEFNDGNFKLKKVFNLAPLPSSYHATLLGCGSGKSKTTTSNDVLGLVSAFLYSGASSTVSALWTRIDDMDAAMYSKHFYSHFEHVLENNDGPRVVNLAIANQKAVLEVMKERPNLYHWAPFVLNGYWMYRIPLQS